MMKKRRKKNKKNKKGGLEVGYLSFLDEDKFFPSPPTTLKYLYDSEEEEKKCGMDPLEGPEQSPLEELYYKDDPVYPEGIEDVLGLKDEDVKAKGKRKRKRKQVDIVDVLSNKGKRDYLVTKNGFTVDVNSLKGQYVVVCCVSVPILNDSSEIDVFRAMMAAHSQLPAGKTNNFQIVLVAKMRSHWDQKPVFDHFFSGFLDDTLAIPFWDCESRDRLCKSLSLGQHRVATLVVDPQGWVLQFKDADDHFRTFGVEFFPFTDKHLADLEKQFQTLRFRLDPFYNDRNLRGDRVRKSSPSPPSLSELLGCDSLSKIGHEHETILVSELSEYAVGVYLCKDGSYLDFFHTVQQQCNSEGRGFVIVLACIAFEEDHSSFLNHIKLGLKKRGIESWWLVPFNDKVSRRLCRIALARWDEQLIIVSPGGKSVELEGREVLEAFKDIENYPFTRKSIMEKRLSELKSVTLDSLFEEYEYLVRGDEPDCTVADLRGRKVLLYLDCSLYDYDERFYSLLSDWYFDIVLQHPKSEVVFLPLGSSSSCYKPLRKMPWLTLPFPSASVTKQLFPFKNEHARCRKLITFGEDGKILSRDAYLDKDEKDISSLFDDTLRQEILTDLLDYDL